jgi:TolB-like protein
MGQARGGVFAFEGYTLDLTRGCVRNTNGEIELRPKSFELLSYLVANAGRLISKDELVNAVWPDVIVTDDSLAQCVSDVRRALKDLDRQIIKTVPRRGYVFAAPVSVRPPQWGGTQPVAITGTPPRLSIVVLPFTNLSNDPEQEYFADGITDDLTADLSRISGSFVIAHTTAITYRGKPADVRQIGRELGVRYVLEGSVRRVADQVHVNAQLIDAESGAHIWTDRFDTDRTNLAKAQDEIVGRLARTLHLGILEAAARRIDQENLANADAHDFATRGWAWYYRPVTTASREEAQRAFEQALEIDPQSVEAKVGLATVVSENVAMSVSRSRAYDETRSEQLLLEALERDANYAQAYFAMGRLRRLQNRMVESRIELEKAIALDRNYASAIQQLGVTLLYLGQPEAALPHLEKALQLNPRHGNLFFYYHWLGHSHLLLGDADEAIDFLRKSRAANPRPWYVHMMLAAALGFRGDVDEAKATLGESLKLSPELNSMARLRASFPPFATNPQHVALREKTADVGLRRAGMPEE